MPPTVRLRALLQVIEELVLLADQYLAARWDSRPLMHHLENIVDWLGRSWRRCCADVLARRAGARRAVLTTAHLTHSHQLGRTSS